jgi:pimeloyl-ACP methyl ester carboxylesterase
MVHIEEPARMVGRRRAPWSFAAEWGGQSWLSDLGGPVHWVEFEGPGQRVEPGLPPIVFVHGLGGSHLNWTPVGQALATDRRAVALDLRGFGLTPGSRHDADVNSNAELLDRFVREVIGRPVVLVGNSMGGLISIMQASRNPDTVAGVVLVCPALPTVRRQVDPGVAALFLLYSVPGFGELCLRRAMTRTDPRRQVQHMVELCFADPSRASERILASAEALAVTRARMPGTEGAFLRAARSLVRVVGTPRTYRTSMRAVQAPVLLVQGESDRLVSAAAARRAAADNPGWQTCFLDDVGHTPQLEVPERFVDAVSGWLASLPDTASGNTFG